MTRLRLVMVTPRFWPQTGSAETMFAHLASGLAERGCSITVVTWRWHPRWPAEICFRGIPVVRLSPRPQGRWNTWRAMRSIARWLREHQAEFDLVYVSGLGREASTIVGAISNRSSNAGAISSRSTSPEAIGNRFYKPIVLSPRRTGRYGDCLWQIESSAGRRIKSQCMKAGAFIAWSLAVRRELEAAGYPRQRICDVPLGVPLPPPRTSATRTLARAVLADANSVLRLSDDARLVVSTTRLAAGRGWEQLLAAWPAVAQRWPGARLWLAGESPEREAVQRRIESLDLVGRAAVVGVFDDVETLLAAADLLVAPAPEGGPVSVLEGMAASLPVIAVDLPVHRWLLGGEDVGLMIPPADPAAISAAILRIFEQPEMAGRLGLVGRERAAAEFSIAKMVEEHLRLFEQLLSAP